MFSSLRIRLGLSSFDAAGAQGRDVFFPQKIAQTAPESQSAFFTREKKRAQKNEHTSRST
jgi:hypothetical protein